MGAHSDEHLASSVGQLAKATISILFAIHGVKMVNTDVDNICYFLSLSGCKE